MLNPHKFCRVIKWKDSFCGGFSVPNGLTCVLWQCLVSAVRNVMQCKWWAAVHRRLSHMWTNSWLPSAASLVLTDGADSCDKSQDKCLILFWNATCAVLYRSSLPGSMGWCWGKMHLQILAWNKNVLLFVWEMRISSSYSARTKWIFTWSEFQREKITG